MREVGTDNSIYFNFKKGFTGEPWVEVLRYRPEHSFQTPEVAEWRPLIGPDPYRYCALIGGDHSDSTPALLCHKDTAQGPQ